jgi:hypothetical protein
MKLKTTFAVLLAAVCVFACSADRTVSSTETGSKATVADQPFTAGGTVSMQLDGGSYDVRPAADDHIRITVTGNAGSSKVDIAANGSRADVKVTDTPHTNFNATIEVPATADLVVHQSGGDLVIGSITGNKDLDCGGGDVKVTIDDPTAYANVDASVLAGDIDASAFGGSRSGLGQHFTWSGQGKYTLRAHLGAGDLVLRGK